MMRYVNNSVAVSPPFHMSHMQKCEAPETYVDRSLQVFSDHGFIKENHFHECFFDIGGYHMEL